MDNGQRGQNLVEFALILPLLLLLVLGVINFGYFFTVHTSIVHAAREGVRYGMVHPEDTTGICERVTGQIFLTAPDLSKITVRYDDAGVTRTCDDEDLDSAIDRDGLDPGADKVTVRIEHDLPALSPLIRVFFQIDILAERTITRVPEA
jgi:hypothetical protein